jgi:hypothetical protein
MAPPTHKLAGDRQPAANSGPDAWGGGAAAEVEEEDALMSGAAAEMRLAAMSSPSRFRGMVPVAGQSAAPVADDEAVEHPSPSYRNQWSRREQDGSWGRPDSAEPAHTSPSNPGLSDSEVAQMKLLLNRPAAAVDSARSRSSGSEAEGEAEEVDEELGGTDRWSEGCSTASDLGGLPVGLAGRDRLLSWEQQQEMSSTCAARLRMPSRHALLARIACVARLARVLSPDGHLSPLAPSSVAARAHLVTARAVPRCRCARDAFPSVRCSLAGVEEEGAEDSERAVADAPSGRRETVGSLVRAWHSRAEHSMA